MASTNVDIVLRARDEATAALKKVTGSMESLTSVAARMAGGLRLGALGPGGLIAGAAGATAAAVVNATKQLAEQVEQLDNLSAASGVSSERLQVLQFAFRQGGVDAAALSQGLNFLNRAIATNDPVLAQLGVTSRDTFEAFQQAAVGIASTEDAAERARRTFEVFGRGGAQLIPVLNQLAEGYDDIADAAGRSGNVLTDEQLERMRKLDAQFDALTQTFGGWGKQLVVLVAGPIAWFLEAVGKISEGVQKLDTGFRRPPPGGFPSMFSRPTGAVPFATDNGAAREFAPGSQQGIEEFLANQGYVIEAMKKYEAQQRAILANANEIARLREEDAERERRLFAERIVAGERDVNPIILEGRPSLAGLVGPLVEEIPTVLDESAKAFLKFSETVRGAFDEIGLHVYSGFYTVLTNLTNRTQTFGSAMKTIWQSIASGILSAMAQILSSAITAAFLKLLGLALTAVTGNAAFAMAGDWAAGRVMGSGSNVVAAPTDSQVMSQAPAAGNVTYVIQTISPGEVLQSLTSGAMRTANSRLIEIAAAS